MSSVATYEKPAKLAPYLTSLEMFQNLEQSVLDNLEHDLKWITITKDEVLCHEGEPGNRMYVLVHGRLGVRLKGDSDQEIEVDELHPGVSVGEMGLLTGQERTATVYALAPAALVELSKDGFLRVASAYPELITQFSQAVLPRIQRVQLANILSNLFGEMDVQALHALQAKLEWHYLSNGDMLFRQGDPGDALFIVISGRLKVVIEETDGNERTVGEIEPGETVGEFALITEESRSATLYAIRETNVVKLSKAVFDELMELYPRQMMQITRIIVKRQLRQQAIHSHHLRATTIAVVPIDQAVPLDDFVHQLQMAMTQLGPTLWLNSDRLENQYGQSGAANIALEHPANVTLTHWLSERETKYQYILYQPDPEWTIWTQRCIGQADRILLVTTDGSSPNLSVIEEQIKQVAPETRAELAIIHLQPKDHPTHTRQWLTPRQLHAHHHIRWGTAQHFRRVARRLVDKHVGIVFSGGGARGFIHIGVSRAFEEMEMDVDIIGGTSMGGIVGAAYALERQPEEIREMFQAFASRKQLLDFTLPLVSVVATKKITTLIKKLVGEVHIEDLWRPFFCVSSNITRSEPYVHTQGPLWEALRASMAAIPVFAPSLYDGNVHVDGSYMNNFPLDVMQELYRCHLLIGVNATSQEQMVQPYRFDTSISGWRVLWSKLNPFASAPPVPSIFKLIDSVGFLNSAYHKKVTHELADIMITPEKVGQLSSLDFELFEEIMTMGYEATRQEIISWQKNIGE